VLCVEAIGKFRRWRLVQGESISAIARDLGLSRNPVKRALRSEGERFEYRRSSQPRPKRGPFLETLEAWLEAEAKLPAREQRTAQRIYEALCLEGYTGAVDTVRRHLILQFKEKHSSWGAQKIRHKIKLLHSTIHLPAISTVHAVLDRHGLVTSGRKKRYKNFLQQQKWFDHFIEYYKLGRREGVARSLNWPTSPVLAARGRPPALNGTGGDTHNMASLRKACARGLCPPDGPEHEFSLYSPVSSSSS
jgi:hypothetical protein